jgi:hypothetical protein
MRHLKLWLGERRQSTFEDGSELEIVLPSLPLNCARNVCGGVVTKCGEGKRRSDE